MPRTRASKTTNDTAVEESSTTKSLVLNPPDSNPPRLFVLPDEISPEARIITLPDPARSRPTRYLVCPQEGFFEFSRIAANERVHPKSWLVVDPENKDQTRRSGYVVKDQDLFVATRFDSLFFLLPIISNSGSITGNKKALFKVLDDYIDSAAVGLAKFGALMRDQRYRIMFENRLHDVCDVVEAGDETMFRLSQDKLISVLHAKAQKLVTNGLPASLEEKFVTRALDIPVSGREHASTKVKESELTKTVWRSDIVEDSMGTISRTITEGADSGPQEATSSAMPQHLFPLLRSRIALSFILRSYVQAHLHGAVLASTSTLDFTPLDLHLAHIQEVRGQAQALRTISNNIGRKRSADEDEPIDMEEVKRQKKEEEDKKKKMQSFGVKALSKVNTKGMKKMSSFFTKKGKT